jgi:hypothetical protein
MQLRHPWAFRVILAAATVADGTSPDYDAATGAWIETAEAEDRGQPHSPAQRHNSGVT